MLNHYYYLFDFSSRALAIVVLGTSTQHLNNFHFFINLLKKKISIVLAIC
jgi:hypothetical protein